MVSARASIKRRTTCRASQGAERLRTLFLTPTAAAWPCPWPCVQCLQRISSGNSWEKLSFVRKEPVFYCSLVIFQILVLYRHFAQPISYQGMSPWDFCWAYTEFVAGLKALPLTPDMYPMYPGSKYDFNCPKVRRHHDIETVVVSKKSACALQPKDCFSNFNWSSTCHARLLQQGSIQTLESFRNHRICRCTMPSCDCD